MTFIYAWGPGSATETYCRQLNDWVKNDLGWDKNIVFTNNEGGAGVIGWTAIANAEPDGYTIGIFNSPGMLNAISNPDITWNLDSYTIVKNLMDDPGVIFVPAGSEFTTIEELITAAQDPNRTISVATTGTTTSEALAMTLLQRESGATFRIVPYNSEPEAIVAVRGGHVEVGCLNASDAGNELSNGDVVALVTGGQERAANLPDVPTMIESGYDIEWHAMRIVTGPAGMPEDITTMLTQAYTRAMKDEANIELANNLQMPIVPDETPEQTRENLQVQWDAYQALWDEEPWL